MSLVLPLVLAALTSLATAKPRMDSSVLQARIEPPFTRLDFPRQGIRPWGRHKPLCRFNDSSTQGVKAGGHSLRVRSCIDDTYHIRYEIGVDAKPGGTPVRGAVVVSSHYGVRHVLPPDSEGAWTGLPSLLDVDGNGKRKFVLWYSFGDTDRIRNEQMGLVPWVYGLSPSGLRLDTASTCSMMESIRLIYLDNIQGHHWNLFPQYDGEWIEKSMTRSASRLETTRRFLCPDRQVDKAPVAIPLIAPSPGEVTASASSAGGCAEPSLVKAMTERFKDSIPVPLRGTLSRFLASLQWSDIHALAPVQKGQVRCQASVRSMDAPALRLALRYDLLPQAAAAPVAIRTPLSCSRNFMAMVFASEAAQVRDDSANDLRFRQVLKNSRRVVTPGQGSYFVLDRGVWNSLLEDVHILPEEGVRDRESLFPALFLFTRRLHEGIRGSVVQSGRQDSLIDLRFEIDKQGHTSKFVIEPKAVVNSVPDLAERLRRLEFDPISYGAAVSVRARISYRPDWDEVAMLRDIRIVPEEGRDRESIDNALDKFARGIRRAVVQKSKQDPGIELRFEIDAQGHASNLVVEPRSAVDSVPDLEEMFRELEFDPVPHGAVSVRVRIPYRDPDWDIPAMLRHPWWNAADSSVSVVRSRNIVRAWATAGAALLLLSITALLSWLRQQKRKRDRRGSR